ncbi:hypothetical protein C4J96_2903 [Pseudomonas orientalis]|uniref:putative natural product biosynthesis protein n=1 Tax=Pseudomonas orientalis TaxID=76758 RepID=UPI000F56B97D|nr:putative natural product biosynthesis protein [Pseudomonas orientalis]AZE95019.1 hypothetical protein C4J96_2903 [Pseudomonas orientalis]
MNHQLPAGASRLVSQAARRSRAEPALPEYPSNARCFVHLDARLLPHWHSVFDVCPTLLKLDPPEGLNLFRSFMTWAYRNQIPQDWTYYLNVGRWLLASPYRARIDAEPIEAFMTAAAARWVSTDQSLSRGIALAWRDSRVCDWKGAALTTVEHSLPPALACDFAWCSLTQRACLANWLPVP